MTTLPLRVMDTRRTGWYCRVLREGVVWARQPVALLERADPEGTVAAALAGKKQSAWRKAWDEQHSGRHV